MKYMKINTLLIFMCSLLLLSCNSFLDETPKGKIIPEDVDDFGMMLDDATASYGNFTAYGISNVNTMDDDFKIGAKREGKIKKNELDAHKWSDYIYNTSQDDYDYSNFYHVIYMCNFIISHIDEAPMGSGKYSRDAVKGSALFHRATAYLNLVNIFAKHYDATTAHIDLGVPLMLEADPNIRIGRSTVQEVYDQILSDAKQSEEQNLLPATVEYSFRPTKGANFALLMRTYLYMGNYEESRKYAELAREEIGEIYDYNLLHPADGCPDYGIEGWPGTYDHYKCPDVICFKSSSYSLYYYYNLSDELVELFDKEFDLRYTIFLTPCAWYDDYEDEYGIRVSNTYDRNSGFSKGEVYITEAELALRLNDVTTAQARLNDLRRKRIDAKVYADITEKDPDLLMQLILEERRRELLLKGLRWFDLKRLNKETRWQKTLTHVLSDGTYTLEPNSDRYVLRLPYKVIQANSLIEQNP